MNIRNIIKGSSESFIKYLFDGYEIDLHIAINFTLSNGPYKHIQSQHYLHEDQKKKERSSINGSKKYNDYVKIIRQVGN